MLNSLTHSYVPPTCKSFWARYDHPNSLLPSLGNCARSLWELRSLKFSVVRWEKRRRKFLRFFDLEVWSSGAAIAAIALETFLCQSSSKRWSPIVSSQMTLTALGCMWGRVWWVFGLASILKLLVLIFYADTTSTSVQSVNCTACKMLVCFFI